MGIETLVVKRPFTYNKIYYYSRYMFFNRGDKDDPHQRHDNNIYCSKQGEEFREFHKNNLNLTTEFEILKELYSFRETLLQYYATENLYLTEIHELTITRNFQLTIKNIHLDQESEILEGIKEIDTELNKKKLLLEYIQNGLVKKFDQFVKKNQTFFQQDTSNLESSNITIIKGNLSVVSQILLNIENMISSFIKFFEKNNKNKFDLKKLAFETHRDCQKIIPSFEKSNNQGWAYVPKEYKNPNEIFIKRQRGNFTDSSSSIAFINVYNPASSLNDDDKNSTVRPNN